MLDVLEETTKEEVKHLITDGALGITLRATKGLLNSRGRITPSRNVCGANNLMEHLEKESYYPFVFQRDVEGCESIVIEDESRATPNSFDGLEEVPSKYS